MERTDALDLKEIANEFTVIQTSGTTCLWEVKIIEVLISHSVMSSWVWCPVQNLRVRL